MKMRVVSVSCSVCRVPHFGRGLSTTWAKDPPNNLGPTCAKLDPNSSQAGPKLAASWPTLTPGWDHVVQTLDRNGEFGLAIFWRNYRGLGSVLASTVGRKWPPLASRNCTNTLHVNCHVLAPLARAYLKYMTIVLECLLWIVFLKFCKTFLAELLVLGVGFIWHFTNFKCFVARAVCHEQVAYPIVVAQFKMKANLHACFWLPHKWRFEMSAVNSIQLSNFAVVNWKTNAFANASVLGIFFSIRVCLIPHFFWRLACSVAWMCAYSDVGFWYIETKTWTQQLN